ncbi:AMP-binding protein [Streptomyces polyrhachis]|uniref:AMP-binding protein n=1 Tax=Streptomyces polyrhachis TaxID=1282885 RepID=A0ABW2GNL0_9ACTN
MSAGGSLNEGRLKGSTSRVAQYVGKLEAAGVTDGDLVLLAGLRSDSILAASVACWSLGSAVWVSPRALSGRQDGRHTFIVTTELGVERSRCTGRRVDDSVAVVHETSGSTGDSKLAQRSVHSVFDEYEGYAHGLSLAAHDHVRVPVPVAHSFGWGVALSALLSGCHLDVRPFITPASVAVDLDSGRTNKAAMTPSLLRLLVETKRRGPEHPDLVLIGAGRVSHDLDSQCYRRFGVSAIRGYGSSETGGVFIGASEMGLPISSVDIVSPEIGSRGELVISTKNPVLGYLECAPNESRTWRMNDIVDRPSATEVRFVRRKSGPLRVNGRFVELDDFQRTLAALPGVTDVAFLTVPRVGRPDVEEVVAVVSGAGVRRESVADVVRSSAHRGLVLRLRVYESLPRTQLGKVDLHTLAKWVARDVSREI